jgi:excisionase family DNA binding protein
MQKNADPLMTVREVADRLRVSDDSVRRMIAAGELRALQLGGVRHRPIRVAESTLRATVRGWSQRGGR